MKGTMKPTLVAVAAALHPNVERLDVLDDRPRLGTDAESGRERWSLDLPFEFDAV